MNALKAILGLLLLAWIIILGYKAIPPYMAKCSFDDYLESQLKVDSYRSDMDETDMAAEFAAKAATLGIPITADQIHVSRQVSDYTVTADYSVPVNVPLLTFNLNFHVEAHNHKI
jgi:hypothetical protein